MGQTGRLKYMQATLRVGRQGVGVPEAGPGLDSPSITITAANHNAGTIWIKSVALAGAVNNAKTGIPLTAGQSFTFTGVPLGVMGYRNVSTASPNMMYFACNATPRYAIIGYYQQV